VTSTFPTNQLILSIATSSILFMPFYNPNTSNNLGLPGMNIGRHRNEVLPVSTVSFQAESVDI